MELSMKRTALLVATAFLPLSAAAQQDPSERLSEVLPPEVSAQVLAHITAAQDRELPTQAVANLAIEAARYRRQQLVL